MKKSISKYLIDKFDIKRSSIFNLFSKVKRHVKYTKDMYLSIEIYDNYISIFIIYEDDLYNKLEKVIKDFTYLTTNFISTSGSGITKKQ